MLCRDHIKVAVSHSSVDRKVTRGENFTWSPDSVRRQFSLSSSFGLPVYVVSRGEQCRTGMAEIGLIWKSFLAYVFLLTSNNVTLFSQSICSNFQDENTQSFIRETNLILFLFEVL